MWGWLCRRPSLTDLKTWEAVCKALLKTPKAASVQLAKILRGHRWDVRFMATCTAMSVMHRFVSTTGTVLEPWRRAKSGWVGALRRGMSDLGWSETRRPWSWRHVSLNANISLTSSFLAQVFGILFTQTVNDARLGFRVQGLGLQRM